jgi:CBS domain-containing protein
MMISHVLRDKGGEVYTLSAEVSLEQAAQEMTLKKVGALVVVDDRGALIGVLSERDIVRQIAKRGAACLSERVSTVMTRNVITAERDETLEECLGRMTDRRVRHLPVLVEGRLIGIVSIGDLVKHRIEAVEAEAKAMQAYIVAN